MLTYLYHNGEIEGNNRFIRSGYRDWESAKGREDSNATERLKTGAEQPNRETLRWARRVFRPTIEPLNSLDSSGLLR